MVERTENDMKVLVTGSAGFIGFPLARRFLARGDEVLNIDFAAPPESAHAPYWRKVDIRDPEAVAIATRDFQPTHIVHLAALA